MTDKTPTEAQRETRMLRIMDPIEPKKQHIVEAKTYLTGREVRAIDAAVVSALNLNTGDQADQKTLTGDIYTTRQDKQIEAVIVSVNGDKSDIVDHVLDLPAPVSNEIIEYVRSVAEPKKERPDSKRP